MSDNQNPILDQESLIVRADQAYRKGVLDHVLDQPSTIGIGGVVFESLEQFVHVVS
jgi:hypothetical protein